MQDQIALLEVLFPSSRCFIFMAHVKLYYNNSGYTFFSYIKVVFILDIVVTGGKQWKNEIK